MKKLNQLITFLVSCIIVVNCFGQFEKPTNPLEVYFNPEMIKNAGIRSVTVYAELADGTADDSLATSGVIAEGEFDKNGYLSYHLKGCDTELSPVLNGEDGCILSYPVFDENGRKIQFFEEGVYYVEETHYHYDEEGNLTEIIKWDDLSKKAHIQFQWSDGKMIESKILSPLYINMQFDERGRFISSAIDDHYSSVNYIESGDTLRMVLSIYKEDQKMFHSEMTLLASSNRLLYSKTNMAEMPGMNDEKVASYDAQGNAVKYILTVKKEDLFSEKPANMEIENTYNANGLLSKRVFYNVQNGERKKIKTELFTYEQSPLKEKREKGSVLGKN